MYARLAAHRSPVKVWTMEYPLLGAQNTTCILYTLEADKRSFRTVDFVRAQDRNQSPQLLVSRRGAESTQEESTNVSLKTAQDINPRLYNRLYILFLGTSRVCSWEKMAIKQIPERIVSRSEPLQGY